MRHQHVEIQRCVLTIRKTHLGSEEVFKTWQRRIKVKDTAVYTAASIFVWGTFAVVCPSQS